MNVETVEQGVRLFMRVEGQEEIFVGRAERMSSVPELLHAIADHWHDLLDTPGGALFGQRAHEPGD